MPSAVSLGLVILAGGRSSRMGRDKAALPWRGATLLTDMLRRSKVVAFDEIIISANDQPALSSLPPDLPSICVVADEYRDCGPLGGMEAAFRLSTCSYCLVVSVDLPFYDFSPVRQILPQLACEPSADVFLPVSRGRPQPLAALYKRKTALKAIRQALAAGRRRVLAITDSLAARVLEPAVAPILYENINTPAAYKDALAIDVNRRRAVPIVTIAAGQSGDGKTTLAVQVIAELTRRGYAVGYIKSTHHRFCREKAGSDTDRADKAGAVRALLCSPDDVPTGYTKQQRLLYLSQQMPADLVLIESRSHGVFPILYLTNGSMPIRQKSVTAVIGDTGHTDASYRRFSPEQLDAICSYILYVTTS